MTKTMAPLATVPTQFVVATQGILKNNALLATALQAKIDNHQANPSAQAVLAWGQRPSAKAASKLAQRLGVPLWTAEDGFLRSLDSGVNSRFGASFILDDLGVYFDSSRPSRLESLLAQRQQHWQTAEQERATRLIASLMDNHLSKYNPSTNAPTLSADAVLIIDQVAGDASILGAGATEQNFFAMLADAISVHQQATIYIKAHPAANTGFLVDGQGKLHTKAQAYLQAANLNDARIEILSMPANPIALLKQVQTVYTVSSHLGFEALMLGKAVHCFGVSWYAVCGLTIDHHLGDTAKLSTQVAERRRALGIDRPSVEQLFYAAYIDYSHYANPATKTACQIEQVIEYLLVNRAQQARLAGSLMAYDFSRWKYAFVRRYAQFPKTSLIIKPKTKIRLLLSDKMNAKRVAKDDQAALARPCDRYLVWGLSAKKSLSKKIAHHQPNLNPPIICMEDGFIRSNGLGATLIEPLSVVMDFTGVYYDATAPSDLEKLLATVELTETQQARAKRLIETLRLKKVSKYNVGDASNTQFVEQLQAIRQAKPTASVHLVVGQVEDDASVQNCTSQIKTNAQLLQRVRADYPDAIVIYKPHPDVEAGLRTGKIDEPILACADLVASHIAMPECLNHAGVVHTISSLTGFEALLRGVPVVCYGLPFYAGFGLTHDVIEPDNEPKLTALTRRQRSKPLDLYGLVYATLIEYPVYALPDGYGLANVEDVVAYLYDNPVQTAAKQRRFGQFFKTNFMKLRQLWLQKRS